MAPVAPRFRDRAEAGAMLAERLRGALGDGEPDPPLILALPRGGVPVARPVARALGGELDLLLVRKIGAPHQPELALGAVVEGDPPQTVLNEEILRALGVPASHLARRTEEARAEIARRRLLWLGGRPPAPRAGRRVVVVDDGVATGATLRAALAALGRAGARRLVVAAPIAPPDTARALRALCDDAVFLAEPEPFGSVGRFYEDFRQVEDGEVAALLRGGR